MPRFLYYIPGVGGANSKMLSDRGLLTRFAGGIGGTYVEHGVTTTPEGPKLAGEMGRPSLIGCIVAAGSRPASYQPERQQWTPLASIPQSNFSQASWVGLEDVSMPPGPADLEKESGVAGYEIKLADGNSWRVPLIRSWDEDRLRHKSALPQAIAGELVNGKYEFVSKVRGGFAPLDAKAERIFEAFCSNKVITVEALMTDAAELLAVNYRLGVEEIMLLSLLTEELAMTLLGLAIDTPGIQRCGAKIARAGIISRQTPRPSADTADPSEASHG